MLASYGKKGEGKEKKVYIKFMFENTFMGNTKTIFL
jgi:hypothetical protein